MLEYLPNGHQVILTDRGHQDIGHYEGKAYITLFNTFYQSGKVDDSGFSHVPIDFNDIKPTYQKMGRMFYTMKRLGLANLVMKFM